MPYKNKEDAVINYYKKREKRLEYQRKYDRKNKDKKRAYDKKRWKERKNKNVLNHYSRRNYFIELFSKYEGCQKCGSEINLDLHHKKYTKSIKDVLLLCQNCHKELHRKRFKPKITY